MILRRFRPFTPVILACLLGSPVRGQCDLGELRASDGEHGDNFGNSVSIDGDYAVIGAWQDSDDGLFSGAVYVFRREGLQWVEIDKLTASDASGEDNFGHAVAMSGDWIIVGSPDAEGPDGEGGAVYLFERTGDTWTERQKISASDGTRFQVYGRAVAMDGAYAAVGAEGDGDHGIGAGAVYVLHRVGGTWSEQDKPDISDLRDFDAAGVRLDMDGDELIVGVKGSETGRARAVILSRAGQEWTEQATIAPAVPEAFDGYGFAVAIDDGWAMVGASSRDGQESDSGMVFAYSRSGGAWPERQQITQANPLQFEGFGVGVAIDGDLAMIGAGTGGEGSVRTFRRTNERWYEVGRTTALNPSFGWTVALSTPYAVAGAPLFGNGFAKAIATEAATMPFAFAPEDTALDVTITFPGLDPQVFTVHFRGLIELWGANGCVGLETLQATTIDLQMVEPSVEVMLPGGGTRTLENIGVSLIDAGPPVPFEEGCCKLPDGCCTTLPDYLMGIDGIGGSGASGAGGIEFLVFRCLLYFLVGIDPSGGDPVIQFPIDLAFPVDWGLGEDNPTFGVTGEIEGTLVACTGDLDGSGVVDFGDVLAILAVWGQAGGPEDLDGSGVVDVGDILIVLGNWGPCE